METKTLSLVGKTVKLAIPGSLAVLGHGKSSDVSSVSARVLAGYEDDSLLVEIAGQGHEGRRFLIPRDRYDIELSHAEPVFARKERIPGGDVRVVMTSEPPLAPDINYLTGPDAAGRCDIQRFVLRCDNPHSAAPFSSSPFFVNW